MADTRKDKRAPISLKVRFKSATLDEFIEQYSADISRGGIFIKAKSPMSVGTLLKFEFRLKDESRLIHGVGRVVWKREEGDASGKPPGMGIKFIKMDPESRNFVEQMVAKRGDAPGRFEEGQAPEAPSGGGGFFPSTTPASELPAPEDRTQVRHASEFLASALAGGGSESASKEAEAKAEEARKRTEEIEKRRAEQARRKSPRLKKTLVGVGVPDAAAIETDPIAAPAVKLDPPADEAKADEAAETQAAEAAPGAAVAPRDEDEHDAETKVGKIDPETLAALAPAIEKATKADEADDEQAAAGAEEEKEEPKTSEAKAEDADAKKAEDADAKKAEDAAKAETKAAVASETKASETEKAEPAAKAEEPKTSSPAVAERPAAREPEPLSEPPRSRAGMVLFGLVATAAAGLVVWHYFFKPPVPDIGDAGQAAIANEPALPVDLPVPDEETDQEDDEEGVEPEAADPVPTVRVQVTTTPPGASILVDGETRGTSPLEIELPLGQEATVSTELEGYASSTQTITAVEEQEPIELTLSALEYVVRVETTPAGAWVRSAVGSLTAPGELKLRSAPTEPIEFTANLRGYESGSAQVEPTEFTETEGRMLATVTLSLNERARPAAPRTATKAEAPREPRTSDTGQEPTQEATPAEQGSSRSAGESSGSGTRQSAGGSDGSGSDGSGGSTEGSESGGGAQPSGGSEPPSGGSTTTPDNPFG